MQCPYHITRLWQLSLSSSSLSFTRCYSSSNSNNPNNNNNKKNNHNNKANTTINNKSSFPPSSPAPSSLHPPVRPKPYLSNNARINDSLSSSNPSSPSFSSPVPHVPSSSRSDREILYDTYFDPPHSDTKYHPLLHFSLPFPSPSPSKSFTPILTRDYIYDSLYNKEYLTILSFFILLICFLKY